MWLAWEKLHNRNRQYQKVVYNLISFLRKWRRAFVVLLVTVTILLTNSIRFQCELSAFYEFAKTFLSEDCTTIYLNITRQTFCLHLWKTKFRYATGQRFYYNAEWKLHQERLSFIASREVNILQYWNNTLCIHPVWSRNLNKSIEADFRNQFRFDFRSKPVAFIN